MSDFLCILFLNSIKNILVIKTNIKYLMSLLYNGYRLYQKCVSLSLLDLHMRYKNQLNTKIYSVISVNYLSSSYVKAERSKSLNLVYYFSDTSSMSKKLLKIVGILVQLSYN